ncbi:hypothetical protein BH20ACT8_BH20ACT8_13480 [soil metagenome]
MSSTDRPSSDAGSARDPSRRRSTTSYQPWTLARLVERARQGEDFAFAAREFLDDVYWVAAVEGPGAVEPLLVQEPPPLDDRHDAYVAALAEHLASGCDLAIPGWVEQPGRFLGRFWFPHRLRALDGIALRDAPAAFRRRNVFLHPSALERV